MDVRFKAGGPRPVNEERIRTLAACEQNNAAAQRMPNGITYEQFKARYSALTAAERQVYRDKFSQQMSQPPRNYPPALSKCMAVSFRHLTASSDVYFRLGRSLGSFFRRPGPVLLRIVCYVFYLLFKPRPTLSKSFTSSATSVYSYICCFSSLRILTLTPLSPYLKRK